MNIRNIRILESCEISTGDEEEEICRCRKVGVKICRQINSEFLIQRFMCELRTREVSYMKLSASAV